MTEETAIDLSVVIPCYNPGVDIERTISLLADQVWHGTFEIVVADNGSTDETPVRLAQLATGLPMLRVVDASGKRGAAHARNTGARAARGRSIAFFDADDLPNPGWLAAIGEALAVNTFVGCSLETETLNEPWAIEVRGRPQATDLLPTSEHPYLPAASGGTIGIRRSVFLESGGFDESFPFATMEDLEFCWRIQLAGHRLVFVPGAVVSMQYRHELSDVFEQARRYAFGQSTVHVMYRDVVVPEGLRTAVQAPAPRPTKARRAFGMVAEVASRGGRARWVWRLGWYLGLFQGRRYRRRLGIEG